MIWRWSISLRLTAWFGGIFFVGWMLFGTAMWLNLKRTLTSERYHTLTRRAGRLEELLAANPGESPEGRSQQFSEFAKATGNGLCEVYTSDGHTAWPPPTAAAQNFPWPAIRASQQDQFQQVRAEGEEYWVLQHSFAIGGQHYYLLAAAPESGNQLVLARFLTGLLGSIPVLLLVSSAGGYFLSRRALLPVDRITASARSISITNLSRRLPVVKSGDELQRLAETCNSMLEGLETAVNRIKQFTADASHDLRGPISYTRTVAEVALRNPAADANSRQALADIVEESAKAAALLEDLLTLARADAGSNDTVLLPVDLAAVVEDACEMARPLAVEREHILSVALDAGKTVRVPGDFASLRRLVWILLDNAFKYTPSPGRIDVRLSASSREAMVTVCDNGIGIPESALPRIFDRFYRADPSRGQVEGSGLGLSIARWIADTHHANLAVSSKEDAGTTFRVVFPLYLE